MKWKWLIIYALIILAAIVFRIKSKTHLSESPPLRISEEIAQGPINIEQAKLIIKKWAGRQNLLIDYPPPDYAPFRPFEEHPGRFLREGIIPTLNPLSYEQCYVLKVTDPNPDKKYNGFISVDSWTGEITHIQHCEHPKPGEIAIQSGDKPRIPTGNVSKMIPPQRAKKIARQYIKSYFPNVPVEKFSCKISSPSPTSDGNSWKKYDDALEFSFYRELTNSRGEKVWIGVQRFWVRIGSTKGDLSEIEGCYEPIEISITPALSIDEAVEAGMSFFYGLGAQSVEVESVDSEWSLDRESPNGKQVITLTIELLTTAPPNAPRRVAELVSTSFGFAMHIVCVDGNSGEVRHWETASGGGAIEKSPKLVFLFRGRERKLKHGLLLQNGAVYISFDDLKSLDFKIEQKGELYSISFKDKMATVDNNSVLSKGKVKYLNGSSLTKLKGARVEYMKEKNRFHIWFLNERAFKQGEYIKKHGLPPQHPKRKSLSLPS